MGICALGGVGWGRNVLVIWAGLREFLRFRAAEGGKGDKLVPRAALFTASSGICEGGRM